MTFDAGRIRHDDSLMHYARASNGTAIPSNWIRSTDGTTAATWRPESAGTPSFGSNSNDVGFTDAAGASSLSSRADHVHRGVTSLAHSSNTYTGPVTLETEGSLYIVRSAANTYRFGATGGSAGGGSSSLTVEEVDGSPTDSAVTKIVFPNGTLSITSHVATYTPASSGSFTHSYLGYNTIGGSTETFTANKVYAKKVTVSSAGIITGIGAYLAGSANDSVGSVAVALYEDSSGTPAKLLAVSRNPNDSILFDTVAGAGGVSGGRWFHVPLGYYATAADYWITVGALDNDSPWTIAFDGSGSDRTYASGGQWFSDWGFYSPTTTSNKYSIRASIIT